MTALAKDDRSPDERLTRVLKTLAPGTPLREGLENILRANTGALIVVGDTPQVLELVDGGFAINSEFSPASLYELAKMDGAILLSGDARRILFANAQLVPDAALPSLETGTRHRTAERVARQTGELVIAISQRRHIITVYKGVMRYSLPDLSAILTKANLAVQTLEKYKVAFDQALVNLSALEFEDLVTLADVAAALYRSETVLRVAAEVDRYIIELGSEGRLVRMQTEGLVADVAQEAQDVLRDFVRADSRTLEEVHGHLIVASLEDLLDVSAIGRLLGHGGTTGNLSDLSLAPRGYRALRKLPRLPVNVIENLVSRFGHLQAILGATTEELDSVEGIGGVRARTIREGLHRLREQVLLDRHL
ncbi:MAG: DNA integrity scanning diadenylate cyclase DisA [Symbiobacteriia bacterium]